MVKVATCEAVRLTGGDLYVASSPFEALGGQIHGSPVRTSHTRIVERECE
jgi:hypothetical protein